MAQSANEDEVIPVAEAGTQHSDEDSAKGDDKHVNPALAKRSRKSWQVFNNFLALAMTSFQFNC